MFSCYAQKSSLKPDSDAQDFWERNAFHIMHPHPPHTSRGGFLLKEIMFSFHFQAADIELEVDCECMRCQVSLWAFPATEQLSAANC